MELKVCQIIFGNLYCQGRPIKQINETALDRTENGETDMATFTIEESNSFKSRRSGKTIEASTLAQAKRIASRNQAFYGTVLHIYCNDVLLAHKTPYCGGMAGRWHNH